MWNTVKASRIVTSDDDDAGQDEDDNDDDKMTMRGCIKRALFDQCVCLSVTFYPQFFYTPL